MKTDKNFTIFNIQVRPHDLSGEYASLATNNPNPSLLDHRSDFILLRSHDHFTVALEFLNERHLEPHPHRVQRTLDIRLVNSTTNYIVASKRLQICIPMECYIYNKHISLPLNFDDINPAHTYGLEVRNTRTDSVYLMKETHFFSLPEIHMLPTKWFTITSGSIRCDDLPNKDWMSIDVDKHPDIKFHFELILNTPQLLGHLPELEFRITLPDGSRIIRFCKPECDTINSKQSDLYCHVDCPMSFILEEKGTCHVELRCMTHAISGFTFQNDTPEISGKFTGKSLSVTKDHDTHETNNDSTDIPNNENWISSDDLDRCLDEFIQSQLEESPVIEETSPEAPGNTDSTENTLEELIGLESVKAKVHRYAYVARFNRQRREANLPVLDVPLHSMLLGSPGTGKTTVAKILGKLLHNAGVLSKGHVIERERATLLGQYYSSEAENTLKALEEAQGGILFIDEAYQLYQPQDPRDPGRFVIETLMTALADEDNRDWMLILSGYTGPMKQMFTMNPGLRSRIPESNILNFDDFSERQLMEIAERYFSKNHYKLLDEANSKLQQTISAAYKNRTESFGNARYVMNLIQTDILPAMAERLSSESSPTITQLSTIRPEDIPHPQQNNTPQRPRIGFK